MKNRIIYLDLLKAFAIFLVIWGHAIKHLMGVESHDVEACNVIYSFHMPLFMTIVGFFAANSIKSQPLEFVKHKFKQLLLPAFVWITIFTLLAFVLLPPLFQVDGFSGYVKNMFFQLWFLKSAFLCYIIFYIPQWLLRKTNIKHVMLTGLIISLVISQVIPLMKVNVMFIPFAAGIVISKYQSVIYKKWALFFAAAAGLYFLVYLITAGGSNVMEMSEIKSGLLHGNFVVLHELMKIQIVKTVLGISATVALIALFYGLFKKSGDNAWVSYFSDAGRSTLGIYILQSFILENIMLAYVKIDGVDNLIASLLICPLVSFVILDICLEIIRLIRKNNTLKFWMLGIKKA